MPIPDGAVNFLYNWAYGNADRIQELKNERDALAERFLNGGKASTTLQTASGNGKSATILQNLTPEEKGSVLTAVLDQLGEAAPAVPGVIYGSFCQIQR